MNESTTKSCSEGESLDIKMSAHTRGPEQRLASGTSPLVYIRIYIEILVTGTTFLVPTSSSTNKAGLISGSSRIVPQIGQFSSVYARISPCDYYPRLVPL